MYENFVIILSAPSGTGKSVLTGMLLKNYSNIKLSCSATTRPAREGEIDGFHYYFISQDRFDGMIANSELLEYAGVYGKSYGTPKSEVDKNWALGNDVLLDIDWQGNLSVSKQITDRRKILRIFVLPPSVKELRNRLNNRGADSPEIIEKRMMDAKNTILHYKDYDYVVVNDNLEECFKKICVLIDAKRIENTDFSKIANKLLDE
ncbi:MAG: guanylate kinase [Rickettsiales bacterium]|jgi:guanylate kinase|nr:guanylate kinase [Rickettsiales bacterium]